VIVAEAFGYFAVCERMLESWLLIRDKFLKKGGRMFPAKARLYVGLSRTTDRFAHQQTHKEYLDSSINQHEELHGYDTTLYSQRAHQMQARNPWNMAAEKNDYERIVGLAEPYVQDYETMSIDELRHFSIPLKFGPMKTKTTVYELICWFDFDFTGEGGTVTVSTSPAAEDTRWHQIQLALKSEFSVAEGDTAEGELKMDVNSFQGYLIRLDLTWSNGKRIQQSWDLGEQLN